MFPELHRERFFRELPAAHPRLVVIARRIARRQPGSGSRGLPGGYQSLDLLHAAVDSVLAGERSWPQHVMLEVFLGNVMRSIAYDLRREAFARSAPAVNSRPLRASDREDDPGDPEEMLPDPKPIAGNTYLERRGSEEALQEASDLVANNPVATKMISAMGRGVARPAEMAEIIGIDVRKIYKTKEHMQPKLRHLLTRWKRGAW